jgi:transposase-like protein
MENGRTFSHKDAARYLGVAPQTLYNWRHRRKGPDYVRMGSKIVYRQDDLDRYVDRQRVRLEA